jgi:hypothetical protein
MPELYNSIVYLYPIVYNISTMYNHKLLTQTMVTTYMLIGILMMLMLYFLGNLSQQTQMQVQHIAARSLIRQVAAESNLQPTKLTIDKSAKQVQIQKGGLEDGYLIFSGESNYYMGVQDSMTGRIRTLIYGNNLSSSELQVGDTITVYGVDGNKNNYRLEKMLPVDTTDVNSLEYDDNSDLFVLSVARVDGQSRQLLSFKSVN